MNCRILKDDNGQVTTIACGRTVAAKPCQHSDGQRQSFQRCNRPHTKLCDFKLLGPNEGKTCDRRMCEEHAVIVRPGVDYCQLHAEFAEEDRGELEKIKPALAIFMR